MRLSAAVIAVALGVVVGAVTLSSRGVRDIHPDPNVARPASSETRPLVSPPAPAEPGAVLTLEPPPAVKAPPSQPVAPARAAARVMTRADSQRATRRGVPTPQPTAMPAAAPSEVPAPGPREVVVSAAVLARGRALLTGEDGPFPQVVAEYRQNLGFRAYAQALRALGARFFVRDLDARVLRAELDIDARRLGPIERAGLDGLSLRSRDLSDEPELDPFIWDAERVYGRAQYSVVLLLPAWLDAAVLGSVESAILALQRVPKDFLRVDGEYRRRGADLVLEIVSAHGRAGDVVPLRVIINLSRMPS